MPVSIDLRKAQKVRRHGDFLAIYTWVNDERALVLLPAHRKAAAWFVVCESAAFRYGNRVLDLAKGKNSVEGWGWFRGGPRGALWFSS
ncbi:MAG: hypothetical protein EBX67_10025 [Betaproteobacteria bacterium]|nr:hypothetical protein [Betaproteobacteria bacterium]